MAKVIFSFDDKSAKKLKNKKYILGGKGANLGEMGRLGLPVPPGFTISTNVCDIFYKNKKKLPNKIIKNIEEELKQIEKKTKKKFGDLKNPLLVSVRSGARVSMPGMMDTILNLGLNDKTVEALSKKTSNGRFAKDSYRRFIQMYSNVVLGIEGHLFEELIDNYKLTKGVLLDTDLGMANSHVLLGVNPGLTVSDVISGEKSISDVIIPCKSGIKLISGGTASSNLLNVENKKRYSILNQIDSHLKNINDVKLVVDIAAGAEDNALVFAMACDRIVIVIVGEPTSFVDSYALLKAIFSRSSFKNYCIVVNQVQDDNQGQELFSKFQQITTKFLDINLHYAGSIKSSSKIKKSIINRVPIVSEEPKSEIAQSFLKIAKNIYNTPTNEWGGLTFLSKVKKRA